MPLISGTIPSLINGISQQPASLRMPTQGELQENGFAHVSRGLEKRPCTEHVATITGIESTTSDDVYIHTIRRSEDEAYALIIKGGTTSGTHGALATVATSIKLYDLTGFATGTAGTEVYIQPLKIPTTGSGTGYASGAVTDNGSLNTDVNNYFANFDGGVVNGTNTFKPTKLSATTIADFTFLLNKTKKVKKITTSVSHHPARNYESMIHFKVGDFDADYKIVIKEYDVIADTGEIDKTTILNTFILTFETPDNETVSAVRTTTETTNSNNNQKSVVIKNIIETLKTGVFTHTPVGTCTAASYVAGVVSTGTYTSSPSGLILTTASFQTAMSTIVIDGITVSTVDGVSTATATTSAAHGLNVGATITVAAVTPSEYNGSFTTIAGTTDDQVVYVLGSTPAGAGGAGTIAKRDPWTVTHDTGSSIVSIKNSDRPFIVEVTDGKGDTYMRAINGSDEVPNFGHLPGNKIPLDFVAKISGDTDTGQDDYYVKWNGSVWKETNVPKYPATPIKNVRLSLDDTTMPMQISKEFDVNNKIYYILKPVEWLSRTVGDDTTNPFPSFGSYDEDSYSNGLYTINDIFFHGNRLGFVSDENVILSEAANYFNLFSNTVLALLDTAVIDVAVSNNQVAILNSAIPFQESLLLFSDLQQFKLSSEEFLTPSTVMIDVASGFETSSDAKPVPAGKTIFFPFKRGAYSGIREYMIDQNTRTNDANEISTHIPQYIEGTVQKLAVSSNEETLCVLTDANRKELFIYKYYYADQEKLQSAWSKWKFDADIIDMEFIGSIGFFLFRRGTTIYLEKMNLSVDNATTVMDDKIGVRLDRRVKLEWSGSGTPPALADYYTDTNHDAVGANTETNGVDQKGSELTINDYDNEPRIGQTFTFPVFDVLTTYTVLDVQTVSASECILEITPSIGENKDVEKGLAGPVPNDTSLLFKEREPVYIAETGEEIASDQVSTILQTGTPFSVADSNNTSPVIFVGIPYEFKYRFSEQFVKNNDQSINSGRLQIRNFEIAYDRTGFFNVEVAPKPYDSRLRLINTRQFTGQRIGSLFLGKRTLETGVFRVPIYTNSRDVRITVNSDSWFPLSLQSADWEAYQVLRNQRI